MKTTEQWWSETKASNASICDWLVKQYRGEATAARRIRDFRDRYAPEKFKRTLSIIAHQEDRHAEWILDLLTARECPIPSLDDSEARYWSATLPAIESFETGAAVGAHAEAMRLRRIETIVADTSAPADIRETFARILTEERFHERSFREMAGDAAMAATAGSHDRGLALLGLIA